MPLGPWRKGLALVGESVPEFFKLSLYKFLYFFSMSRFQWCAPSKPIFGWVNHPAWREPPGYRRLGQAYLAWSRSVNGLADRHETANWRTKEQLRFALDLWASFAAPTNSLLGNQAALQKAFESGGTSLLLGSKNWLHDILHNRGMPTQVDSSRFKVGENLAITPGSVVSL